MEINLYLVTVILIMLILILIGCIRGFIHTVFVTLGLVIIVALTAIFNPAVHSFVTNNTKLESKISDKLAETLNLEEKYSQISGLTVSDYVKTLNIPDKIKNKIISNTSDAARDIRDNSNKENESETASKLMKVVYDGLAEMIVGAISYMITFAVASLVVLVLGLLLDIAAKLPGIRQMNKLLGGLMGFVQGYLVISLIYVVAVAFASTEFGSGILEMISRNSLLTWIYGNNFVVDILMKIFI